MFKVGDIVKIKESVLYNDEEEIFCDYEYNYFQIFRNNNIFGVITRIDETELIEVDFKNYNKENFQNQTELNLTEVEFYSEEIEVVTEENIRSNYPRILNKFNSINYEISIKEIFLSRNWLNEELTRFNVE